MEDAAHIHRFCLCIDMPIYAFAIRSKSYSIRIKHEHGKQGQEPCIIEEEEKEEEEGGGGGEGGGGYG